MLILLALNFSVQLSVADLMSVQKEYRRNGIAQKMLKEIERRAQAKGFKRIVLETTNSWHDAISFYKKNEYKEFDRNEYEVHMVKKLF